MIVIIIGVFVNIFWWYLRRGGLIEGTHVLVEQEDGETLSKQTKPGKWDKKRQEELVQTTVINEKLERQRNRKKVIDDLLNHDDDSQQMSFIGHGTEMDLNQKKHKKQDDPLVEMANLSNKKQDDPLVEMANLGP